MGKAERKADRIAKLKKDISTLTHVLEGEEGKRGTCSQCGEEGLYANWGAAHGLICRKCYNENERTKALKKYTHLIGLRVEDLILEGDYYYPLRGIKLEGGYTLEVARDHDGDTHLDMDHRPSKTRLVTIGVPQHQIVDQRWPKQYMENIGKNLLRACHDALKAGTEVVIVRLEKPLEEAED